MARRLAGRYGYPKSPHHFNVTLHPDKLNAPLKRKKPTMYFACSMSDLFHRDVETDWIAHIWGVMMKAEQHTFQVLTKRPARMLQFVRDEVVMAFPNIWLGVTAENQARADEQIPLLLQTPAAVRFVSCEPLLEPIDLKGHVCGECNHVFRHSLKALKIKCPYCEHCDEHAGPAHRPVIGRGTISARGEGTRGIDWVIVGGESGPGARPMHPDWARSIRDQCQEAGTPFFFKQWGAWLPRMLFPDITTCPNKWGTLDDEGNWFPLTTPWNGRQGEESPEREYVMAHVGKKRAGRLLDGKEWNGFPC